MCIHPSLDVAVAAVSQLDLKEQLAQLQLPHAGSRNNGGAPANNPANITRDTSSPRTGLCKTTRWTNHLPYGQAALPHTDTNHVWGGVSGTCSCLIAQAPACKALMQHAAITNRSPLLPGIRLASSSSKMHKAFAARHTPREVNCQTRSMGWPHKQVLC
jgi:hypothetical protein